MIHQMLLLQVLLPAVVDPVEVRILVYKIQAKLPCLRRSLRINRRGSISRKLLTSCPQISYHVARSQVCILSLPLHPLRPLLLPRRNLSQLPPQMSNFCNSIPRIIWQRRSNLPPNNIRQLWPIPIRTNHNLQRPIPMHTPKVEIAFGRYICDIRRYAPFLA